MSQIAELLEVSSSHLSWSLNHPRKERSKRYFKSDDFWILERIQRKCAERPTYGYRRITALLNRDLVAENKPKVNPKRIYRIMKENHLLLQKGKPRTERVHDGKVITLLPNTRWCSDGFEFRCFNQEKVFVAFIEDTCDREAISWVASKAPMTSLEIRDLLVEAMEKRFGAVSVIPKNIEFLADNGGCYRANETKAFARDLGFTPCFTPSYSPESNGMSEALVKTIKREYVYTSDRIDTADQAILEISRWFEDYNEYHPHKGLKMKSPREFIRSLAVQ